MKKKIFGFLFVLIVLTSALTPIVAATFSYDTSLSASRTSGYSHASDNRRCSVEMKSTFLMNDYVTTATVTDKDVDVYPTVSRSLPSSGAYFTKVRGVHVLGGNTYYSEHVR